MGGEQIDKQITAHPCVFADGAVLVETPGKYRPADERDRTKDIIVPQKRIRRRLANVRERGMPWLRYVFLTG